jgi:NADH dehydrogenase/NADH:ubiquinone oxidoreductase subunit G
LQEKSIIELGQPEHSLITTCAYCGVGCGFKAEMKGNTVVRMVPWKDGKANEGHSCVKGRFAWGYATHQDRITTPMIRDRITDPWKVVSWDEALTYAATRIQKIQAEHGKDSVGGITSSRCTNEETYLVQKLVRAAFGTNNVDTCARVCHSPTGYGLGQTLGTSAGTQTFKSVEQADVIMVIGANPSDAHPVFASRMKRRLRQGARSAAVVGLQVAHVDVQRHRPQLGPGVHGHMRLGQQHHAGHAAGHWKGVEQLAHGLQHGGSHAGQAQRAQRLRVVHGRLRRIAAAQVGGEVHAVHAAHHTNGPLSVRARADQPPRMRASAASGCCPLFSWSPPPPTPP